MSLSYGAGSSTKLYRWKHAGAGNALLDQVTSGALDPERGLHRRHPRMWLQWDWKKRALKEGLIALRVRVKGELRDEQFRVAEDLVEECFLPLCLAFPTQQQEDLLRRRVVLSEVPEWLLVAWRDAEDEVKGQQRDPYVDLIPVLKRWVIHHFRSWFDSKYPQNPEWFGAEQGKLIQHLEGWNGIIRPLKRPREEVEDPNSGEDSPDEADESAPNPLGATPLRTDNRRESHSSPRPVEIPTDEEILEMSYEHGGMPLKKKR